MAEQLNLRYNYYLEREIGRPNTVEAVRAFWRNSMEANHSVWTKDEDLKLLSLTEVQYVSLPLPFRGAFTTRKHQQRGSSLRNKRHTGHGWGKGRS